MYGLLAQAKVSQHHMSLAIQHDILGFQIPTKIGGKLLEGTATFGGRYDHTIVVVNITQDVLIERNWC